MSDEGSNTPARKYQRTLESKLKRNKEKHPLREPCDCSKKCMSIISQRQRISVYLEFWKLPYNDRKNFVHHSVDQVAPARLTADANRRREATYIYALKGEMGVKRTVCKKFFLATLGYTPTSSIVATAKQYPANVTASPDKRGKRKLEFNALHHKIDQHIYSYNPSISHYRREHAPNRLYLPHELTIEQMHRDYNEKYPAETVHYSTYTRRVKQLNISFAQLGAEECELCASLKLRSHEKDDAGCTSTCAVCKELADHERLTKDARDAYKSDGATVKDGVIVRSVDLQKVVMLPRLPGFKTVCFVRRLVAFHHTFAPVGEYCKEYRPISIVWNESVAGRKCGDIALAVELALFKDRDARSIVCFMDNCAGQNKNYALFTLLIRTINSKKIAAESICIKYLEAGHTFMSADSCHAAVEREMKKAGDVADFSDLTTCIQKAGSTVIEPSYIDFKRHDGQQSQAKLKKPERPMLADIRVVEFRRGSKMLYYKKQHTDQEYRNFDYLRVKCNLGDPAPYTQPRGIPADKKDGIIKNLLQFMPETRRQFWREIPVSNVNDLIDEFE